MKRTINVFLRARGGVLAVVLVLMGSILGLLTPAKVAQSAACAFRPWVKTYYSDASHTTVIGQSGRDCSCNDVSWGSTSSYHTMQYYCCINYTC